MYAVIENSNIAIGPDDVNIYFTDPWTLIYGLKSSFASISARKYGELSIT